MRAAAGPRSAGGTAGIDGLLIAGQMHLCVGPPAGQTKVVHLYVTFLHAHGFPAGSALRAADERTFTSVRPERETMTKARTTGIRFSISRRALPGHMPRCCSPCMAPDVIKIEPPEGGGAACWAS